MPTTIPWEMLFEAALQARARAYAPYSRFSVGAAVLTGRGDIVAGCNVENASYGLSLCAERCAIASAVAQGSQRLLAVAIVVDTREPCPPCGMCRQAMAELAGPTLPVRTRNLAGAEARFQLKELLPHAFTREFL